MFLSLRQWVYILAFFSSLSLHCTSIFDGHALGEIVADQKVLGCLFEIPDLDGKRKKYLMQKAAQHSPFASSLSGCIELCIAVSQPGTSTEEQVAHLLQNTSIEVDATMQESLLPDSTDLPPNHYEHIIKSSSVSFSRYVS